MRSTRLTLVAAILLGSGCSSFADDSLIGKELRTSAGQPFCENKDELQEFFLAVLKKDKDWMKQLTSCAAFPAGLKVAVIDEYEGSELGHVIKARLFTPDGSAVGYTLNLGLVAVEK